MTGFEPGRARNVLLIVLDTVRAESSYVGGTAITPTLAGAAAAGADFRKAVAPAAWTLPSHASMFTGLYPTEHGATAGHRFMPDDHELLAETVRNEGYATGLFTANAFLTESFNMDRGFETVSFIRGEANKLFAEGLDPVAFLNEREHDHDLPRLREIARALVDGPLHKNAANAVYFKLREAFRRRRGIAEPASWDGQAVEATRRFLKQKADADLPFLAAVNLIGAHAPWEFDRDRLAAVGVTPEDTAPVERWEAVADVSEAQWPYAAGDVSFDETDREILTHLYHAWVRRVDDLAQDLLETLEGAGIADETLVVLTADHGEQIARDGVLGHSVSVDDAVARVPLVVDGPGVPQTRVEEPVSLRDVYGTILAALGIDSEARTLFDGAARGEALIETYGVEPEALADKHAHVASKFGLRRALYTAAGRAERRTRTGESFGDAAVLARLDELVDSLTPFQGNHDEDLPADVRDRLDELGYV